MSSSPINIFISYAHEDEALRDQLVKHLSVLRQQGLITDWHDRQIRAGQAWREEIEGKIRIADMVLMLVSPDFLSSHFCFTVEMPIAMEMNRKNREVKVIPIILRPCDWEHSPLAGFQVLPTDGIPITAWTSRDDAFTNVVKGIRASLSRETVKEIELATGPASQTALYSLINAARSGSPKEVDMIMEHFEKSIRENERQLLLFALDQVNEPNGRARIQEYLHSENSEKRLAAGHYFKTKFGTLPS